MSAASIATDILLPWLNAVALAFVPVAGTLAGGFAMRFMQQHQMDVTLFQAISRAGGEAFRSFVATGAPLTDKAAMASAATVGARYLQDRIPEIIAAKGLSPAAVAQVVAAEMGKLFAVTGAPASIENVADRPSPVSAVISP